MICGFVDCELDMQRHELRRSGAPWAIAPQAFKVLIDLLESRDRVIRKDELLERLWPGQHVSEGTLSQRLMLALKAVGDSGHEQMAGYKKPKRIVFVEQLPRYVNGKVAKTALRQRAAADIV